MNILYPCFLKKCYTVVQYHKLVQEILMKKSAFVFFTAALALTALAGCRTTEDIKNTEANVQKESRDAEKNESLSRYISVDLRSNPTTGGGWKIDIADKSIANLESDTYVRDEAPSGMVGVGGTETFGFKCLKPGKTTVKFVYGQMWEGGSVWETKNAVITVNESLLGSIKFE